MFSLQQRQAHEYPVIFYSVVIGSVGPVMVLTIPPLRERAGYKSGEMIPATYPSTFLVIFHDNPAQLGF